MPTSIADITADLLDRLDQVRRSLGVDDGASASPGARFADLIDSMGRVEFLAIVAAECGVSPTVIEECVHRRFGTVLELAEAMARRELFLGGASVEAESSPTPRYQSQQATQTAWLAGVSARLPARVQSSAALNERLRRPAGWLEAHAGIRTRRIWADED